MNWYFDDESQKIIINAKNEMLNLRHPYVGSEHLFLAILKNEELNVTKILKLYNILQKTMKIIGVNVLNRVFYANSNQKLLVQIEE